MHDCGLLNVTGSTYGYYLNMGFSEDNSKLDYARDGEIYKDLIALLREKSPKFNELFDKQVRECFFKKSEKEIMIERLFHPLYFRLYTHAYTHIHIHTHSNDF